MGAGRALLLPGRCADCSAWGASPLCIACTRRVRWIRPPWCDRCRKARLLVETPFGHAHAAAMYEGPAREALKAFKLLGERRAASWLAARMIPAARALGATSVTWVPATRASEAARGFNPAEELARPLAVRLRLPLRKMLLKRRDTLDSASLSRDQRRVNLLEAFVATDRIGGHVMLVDDIFTSGATAQECAKALKAGGADNVSVITFARAP